MLSSSCAVSLGPHTDLKMQGALRRFYRGDGGGRSGRLGGERFAQGLQQVIKICIQSLVTPAQASTTCQPTVLG